MIPSDMTGGAQDVLMALTPGNGADFQYRGTENGSSSIGGQTSGVSAPGWVKLVRSGDTFTGYYSSDGVNWTEVGSQTIPMSATCYVGLANTSHNVNAINTSTFNDVSLTATTGPVIVTPPSAAAAPVTGTSTAPSVLATDPAGASNLTYTWAVSTYGLSGNSIPVFSDNGDNSAKNVTVSFTQAGTYDFSVTVLDPAGLSTTASVYVIVVQTPTSVSLSPASVTLVQGGSQQFTATAYDQFGNTILYVSNQGAVSGVDLAGVAVRLVGNGRSRGTINGTGLYQASTAGFGTDRVTAMLGAAPRRR